MTCVPIFFLYLESPEHYHSDVAAVAFISVMWTLGGYLNTQVGGLVGGAVGVGAQVPGWVGGWVLFLRLRRLGPWQGTPAGVVEAHGA